MILLYTSAIFYTDALCQFAREKAPLSCAMPLNVKEHGYVLNEQENRQLVAACL